jgi:hypothetical protein
VSCTSQTACTAVGPSGGGNLSAAEAWNGTTWTLLPTGPTQGTGTPDLKAISCPTPGVCVAVGSANSTPLAELYS